LDIKSKLSTLANPLPRPPPDAAFGGATANARTLIALRVRMAELLARGGVEIRQPPRPVEAVKEADFSDLPFVVEASEGGVLWRRQQVLPPSTHVGRIPLEAAPARKCSRSWRSVQS
jgi:hypothetical protein